MNPNEIENRLRQLGADWKIESDFVRQVIERATDDETRFGTLQLKSDIKRKKGRIMIRLGIATLLATSVVLFLGIQVANQGNSGIASAHTLAAEVREVLSEQNSILFRQVFLDDDGSVRGRVEFWYERGKGFARRIGDQQMLTLDNGQYAWKWDHQHKRITRTKSQDFDKLIDEHLSLNDAEYRRVESEDLTEGREVFNCYEMMNLADYADGTKQRMYLYVDSNKRIYRSTAWKFSNNTWNTTSEGQYQYNVAIDPSIFEPMFAPDYSVVDLDEQINLLADIDHSLFQKSVHGLRYAVHRINRLEGGGFAALVSVRPSSEQSDSQLERWNIYDASPQFGGYFRIKMAEARQSDIQLQWFLVASRGVDQPLPYDDEPFNFEDLLSVNFQNQTFEFVPINVSLDLKDQPAISIAKAARLAYEEQKKLPDVSIRSLDMGVVDNNGIPNGVRGSVDSTTEEEYTRAVADHLEHWRRRDLDSAAKAMEQQITKGTTIVTVPAVMANGNSNFGDKELERAAKRKELVVVDISKTSVTDQGMAHLTALDSLRSLYLKDTQVGDKGIKHLEGLKSLKEIDLRGTKVTRSGIDQLKKALPKVKATTDSLEVD